MRLNLRALAQFLRDACAACRPSPERPVGLRWVDTPTPNLDDNPAPYDEPLYHAVVSEMAEALAAARAASVGDADWAAWTRELTCSHCGGSGEVETAPMPDVILIECPACRGVR